MFAGLFGPRQPARGEWVQLSTSLVTRLESDRLSYIKSYQSHLDRACAGKRKKPPASDGKIKLLVESYQFVTLLEWFGAHGYFSSRKATYEFLDIVTAQLFGPTLPDSEAHVRELSSLTPTERVFMFAIHSLDLFGYSSKDLDKNEVLLFTSLPMALVHCTCLRAAEVFRDEKSQRAIVYASEEHRRQVGALAAQWASES